MVKASELSSDISVIKEFEELKLKQKLLIESLKNNTDSNQNKLFLEINSKLDFLVKIFTEANQADNDEEEKVDFNSKFNEILESVSSFSQETKDSFSKLDERIAKLEKIEVEVPEVELDKPKVEDIKTDEKKVDKANLSNVSDNNKSVNVDEQKKSIDSSNVELPPIPKPDFEIKIDELAKDEKKKKWF